MPCEAEREVEGLERISNQTETRTYLARQNLRLPIILGRIPRLHKSSLCPIRVVLILYFLDGDSRPVFRKHHVFLLQLVDAAFGELVGVEIDLWGWPLSARCTMNEEGDDAPGILPSPRLLRRRREEPTGSDSRLHPYCVVEVWCRVMSRVSFEAYVRCAAAG